MCCCRQLRLLLWKSYTQKKRAWVSTLFEILVPVIAIFILSAIRSAVDVKDVAAETNYGFRSDASDSIRSVVFRSACGLQKSLSGKAEYRPQQYIALAPDQPEDYAALQGVAASLATAFSQYVGANETTANAMSGDICPFLQPAIPVRDYALNDMIRVFPSSDDLAEYYKNEAYDDVTQSRAVYMAVNFASVGRNGLWEYNLRSNITNTPWTGQMIDPLVTGFDQDQWNQYLRNGVLAVQYLLNQLVIKQTQGAGAVASAANVTFLPFPTRAHKQDDFKTYVENIFGAFLIMAFIWPFSRMVRNMVEEKEKRLKEVMKIMGLRNSFWWIHWGITYLLVFTVSCVLVVLAARVNLFKYSDAGVLFAYFFFFSLSLLSLAFLVSTFFSRAKLAGTVSPFIMLLFYLPYMAVSGTSKSHSSKTSACLLSPVAAALGSVNILSYETAFIGVRWTNINESTEDFEMATALGFMIFDAFLYFVLAIYCDLVIPQEYGSQLPWYFPVTPKFWKSCFGCCGSRAAVVEQSLQVPLMDINENAAVEEHAEDVEPVSAELRERTGVRISQLTKMFQANGREMTAVDKLALEMYQGQIFVLLGHNGAGKTTTINMLTGMMQPTSGTANIFGRDIVDDMDSVRKLIGICPQHNALFDSLTVEEHLSFFGSLKGMSGDQLKQSINQAMTEVELGFKANVASSALSGGQQRRLSLAIALIGDSNVVFLDEPTSGVDPSSRRAIWNLLASKKAGRVIILTTHFMDEADQLGDRIGIMQHGKLRCAGSPLFLKRRFGVGYQMVFTMGQGSNRQHRQALQQIVHRHVPEANKVSEAGAEIVLGVPLSCSHLFPALLQELDQQRTALCLENYGLSVTTLENVFLKVAMDDRPASASGPSAGAGAIESKEYKQAGAAAVQVGPGVRSADELSSVLSAEPVEGSKVGGDLKALLRKRIDIQKRDRKALCCQYLLPLILLAVGLGLLRIPPNPSFPVIDLSDTGAYASSGGAALVPVNPTSLSHAYEDNLPSFGLKLVESPASDPFQFTNQILDSVDEYPARYGALTGDLSKGPDALGVFGNGTAPHGVPTFYHLATASLLKNLSNGGTRLVAHVQPLDLTWRQRALVSDVNGIFTAIVVAFGFSFIPASYAVFVVLERESKAKHLQLISGVNIVSYWTSNFIFDFVNFLIPATIGALIILAYGNPNFVGENFSAVVLLFIMYGLAIIPFTYIWSFLFKSHSTAQNVMILVYMVSGIVLTLVDFALDNIPSTKEANRLYIRHLFRLMPAFCLGDSIFYLSLRSLMHKGMWDLDVTGYDLLFLAVEAIVFFAITLLIELFAAMPSCAAMCKMDPNLEIPPQYVDEDVGAERQRIQTGHAQDDLVRIEGLCKYYRPALPAVHDLWFGIPAGECFGFLGVNGAGKTTTIKMLTGDVTPTRGQAYLGGFNIATQPLEVRRLMGYCPQFDALHELLTGRETLFFYGRIRGIPQERLATMVDFLVDRLSLTEHANKPAGTYSGGNKRKLSVAIALIGNPKVVFLDEPSTGMDPVSRRFMWDFISETSAGRAVILTTHSMEECEALCRRIGIIAAGQLRCLGSSQHLKHRFGRGYQLDISTAAAGVDQARQFIERTFPGAHLLECYGGNIKYRIQDAAMSLRDMFSVIEQNKATVGISEYAIGQTTLEMIFLAFAGRHASPSSE